MESQVQLTVMNWIYPKIWILYSPQFSQTIVTQFQDGIHRVNTICLSLPSEGRYNKTKRQKSISTHTTTKSYVSSKSTNTSQLGVAKDPWAVMKRGQDIFKMFLVYIKQKCSMIVYAKSIYVLKSKIQNADYLASTGHSPIFNNRSRSIP